MIVGYHVSKCAKKKFGIEIFLCEMVDGRGNVIEKKRLLSRNDAENWGFDRLESVLKFNDEMQEDNWDPEGR